MKNMIVITGDCRIIKDLDRAGVIKELQTAQQRGDKFCSVVGNQDDDFRQIEREAGYTIGASEAECETALAPYDATRK